MTKKAIFEYHSNMFDEVFGGTVEIDNENNIIKAYGPDGFEIKDFSMYTITIL